MNTKQLTEGTKVTDARGAKGEVAGPDKDERYVKVRFEDGKIRVRSIRTLTVAERGKKSA